MNTSLSGKKKILSMLLCLLLALTFVLSSCTGDGGEEESTTAATTAPSNNGGSTLQKDDTIEDWLPMNKYTDSDGNPTEFMLLNHTDYNTNYMFFQYETSDDPLRSAAYSRTMQISEIYGLAFDNTDSGDCQGVLQASIMGGGGDYDLIYPSPAPFGFMEEKLITDLNTYENIHLDQKWWNQSAKVYRFDDRVYFAASDFSICGQGLVGLIFNRDLWNDLQLDYDLYGMVWDKTWTMDKLREIAMLYGSSSDDVYDLTDSYGMIYQKYHTNGYYWSMGGTLINYDEYNNTYSLGIEVDLTSQMGTALHNLMWNSENKVYRMENVSWSQFATSEGWAAYKQGNSLFMSYEFGALFRHLLAVTFDLGYMPLPKLTVEQQNYPALCGAGFFMIPRKAKDAEMSSIILEACCIVSYTDFRPAFFETILLGRMSKIEEDYEMLEYLHENKFYDLGYTLGTGGGSSILTMVHDKKTGQIASFIKGRSKEMSQTLKYIDEIRAGMYAE